MTNNIYPLENKLKELRLGLGLRQEDVAKLLGMDCTDRLSQWERGQAIPNLVNLFKLCIFYQTIPNDLYKTLWKQLEISISNKTRKLNSDNNYEI